MNVKMTLQILYIWKITNYDVMAAILEMFENKCSVKSLGTPICIYILSFVKIGIFLRKLEIWLNAQFTYDATAAIVNTVDSQFNMNTCTDKLKAIVKTLCLYLFWFCRSNPDKLSTKIQNGCHGGNLRCRIQNIKKKKLYFDGLPTGKVWWR